MCFGIRISSPFHLATLILPIANHKCPKNAKNACADALISPHWWWPGLQLINHLSGEESFTFKSMNFHLTSSLERSVILHTGGETRGLCQSGQWSCLASGYVNYCVHQHGNEPQFSQNFVMFRSQESLLRQVRRREGTSGILSRELVFFIEAAG